MKIDILKEYSTLRSQLEKERIELRARLTGIEAVLGGEIPKSLPSVDVNAPAKPKRRMSAKARAAIGAAAKARWAALRAKKSGKKTVEAAPAPARKAKKKISAAARARISAAAKARWAKAKAAGKTSL